VMRVHLDRMIEVFGETIGCRMYRKVAPWYSKRFGPVAEFNRRVVQISTREDFERVLADYLAWRAQFAGPDGELLEKYRPAPMVASFMKEQADEPSVARRESIPVPKGPVEVW
ncbi:MAG: tRNA dihydrouridine synthase DusB, partial [Verrucomicrobiae bacterium]|nr:tRNA dihydrouridine synthase DusB [Verrucomicrobiae bacterium]